MAGKKDGSVQVEEKVLTEEELLIAEILADAKKKVAEIKNKNKGTKVVVQIQTSIDQLTRLLADPMDITSVICLVKRPEKKTYININAVL